MNVPEEVVCPGCGATMPGRFRFCADCGHGLADAAAAVRRAAEDERRDVTVLFADVSGFTAMSERLDPETVHRVMNDCFDGLGAAIAEEGGHIDKFGGDSVMALFGAPVAHDDDPARAARAALAMQSFLADFATRNRDLAGAAFRMRVGIHCGLVLAGHVGSASRRAYSVMGDTVNLASRLETSARPGSILVSQEMARRLGGAFAFGPATTLAVKGKTGPVTAFELLREVADAEPAAELPFVGRADLIDRLIAAWRAEDGSGARLAVLGPAGIGKTRLVRMAAAKANVPLIQVAARAAGRRRPFSLARGVVQAVRAHVAGGAAPASPGAFARDLAPVALGLGPYMEALWFLAAPASARVEPPDPDPRTLRRTLTEGFGRLLANLRQREPALVIFLDGFDECDEASAALVANRETLVRQPPVVVALRTNDGLEDVWPSLTVPPMTAEEAAKLLARVEFGRALPPALRADVIRRAQGIPLYLHEMLVKLMDAGVLRRDGEGWVCDPDTSAAILPESLVGALVARADALEPRLRRLLLECSVQGPEFDVAVAAAVARSARGEQADTEALLRRLAAQDLVEEDPSDAGRWSFRQELMQAACYQTLLLSERRRLHRETGRALAADGGGPDAGTPELLAYHFEAAEAWAEAAAANERAGARAVGLYANAEAADRYDRAIAQAETAGRGAAATAFAAHDGGAQLRLVLGAYDDVEQHALHMLDIAQGPVQRAQAMRLRSAACASTGRTEEAARHLSDARALLDAGWTGHAAPLREILFDCAQLDLRAARLADARAHAEESRRLCDAGDRSALIRHDILDGRIAHTEGRFADAAAHYRAAFEAAEASGSVSEQARAANYMGDAARDVGAYAEAERYFARALELWSRIGDAEGVAGAQNNLANLAMSRGDLDGAEARHRLALEAFEQIGNVNGAALARANLAILALERGQGEQAVAEAGRALALLDDVGTALLHALTRVVLGDGHLAAGDLDAAEAVFRGVVASGPPPLAAAGAERGLGRVLLKRDEAAAALSRIESAYAVFDCLGRRQEAGRTLLDLAEAQHLSGDAEAARRSLASARDQLERIGAHADVGKADALAARLGIGIEAIRS